MYRSWLVSSITLITAVSSLFSSKPEYPAVRLVSPYSIMVSASLTGILLFRGGSITTVVLGLNRPSKDVLIIWGFRGDSTTSLIFGLKRPLNDLSMIGLDSYG